MQKLQNRAARVVTKSDYDVSSMSADEKRIKKAKLAAEKRRSDNPRGNANNVKKFKTGGNQLFRGEYNVTYIVLCGILGWCYEHYPCYLCVLLLFLWNIVSK